MCCVIGAGLSGLVAIKELLDEGHEVTCFEREERIGGVFNFPVGVAYDSMRLTVSQYFMAFSSFPPPADQKRYFWNRKEYMDYLVRFSTEFDLFKHIQLRSAVTKVRSAGHNRFEVTVERDGNTETARFDAVAICRGAFRGEKPRLPSFKGAETFSGEIVHAASYRDPGVFAGKRVVCVGMGETSADVTAQIAEVADACWLSFRRYPMLLERYPSGGSETSDSYSARIFHWQTRDRINAQILNGARIGQRSGIGARGRLIVDWLSRCENPGHKSFQKNDDFIDSVLSGKTKVVPSGIDELNGETVRFADGTTVSADVIMCCTGYEESTIPETWFEGIKIDDVRRLYKHAFHPDLGARVVFIGWTRPLQGGVPALSEMIGRYFSLLCSGKRELPPRDELIALIGRDRAREDQDFRGNPQTRTLVNYTEHMDQLAELVGCKPDLADYEDDPELLLKLLAGSNIALCYRLRGPHAMPEFAREVITKLPVAVRKDVVLRSLEEIMRIKGQTENLPEIERLKEIIERAYSYSNKAPAYQRAEKPCDSYGGWGWAHPT
jgi:dimethylaniline monooxygenase (N-oxide forming)